MAGYTRTPLWKKLGIRPGDRVLLVAAPSAWGIPDPPTGVRSATETRDSPTAATAEVAIAFFSSRAELREGVPALAPRIFPAGALWVAWPRRAGGHDSDIRDQDIRDVALPMGLVDVKVAALDDDWSGLRLVWRVERRHTSQPPSG